MARLLARLARSVPAPRSRAPAWTVAIVGALALTGLPRLLVSTSGARPGLKRAAAPAATAPPTATGPKARTEPPPGVHPPLYRTVGCRSRGGPFRHGPERRAVAIGFDDGPTPDTGAFVSMLERAKAKATFFMIGREVSARYRQTLLRELRDGDALGDHSFTHPYLTHVSDPRAELGSTLRAIASLTGYAPCVFRPPYGAYDTSVVQVAGSLGLATVLWNVDPRDWALPGRSAIVRQVLAQVRPGSIIISHDGGGPRGETLAAYPSIIAALRARGYRTVTIPELLGFRPVYRPCILLCDGIGVPRRELPRDAIIEKAR
jgi:peptidoglycan/xylan/chitin deacetylase (PgdA/CDA1 family)